jgi:brefeldin A-inhibited guanine nucleotide-exchange protein
MERVAQSDTTEHDNTISSTPSPSQADPEPPTKGPAAANGQQSRRASLPHASRQPSLTSKDLPPPPPPAEVAAVATSEDTRANHAEISGVPPNSISHVERMSIHSPRSPSSQNSYRSDVQNTQRTSAVSFTSSRGQTVSVVLITSALETISASKEAKRSAQLRDAVKNALQLIHSGTGGNQPREIFEPLRLACETRNEKLVVASLDCISKLVSYSFFVEPFANNTHFASPPASPTANGPGDPPASLADLVAHTIISSYTETTPDAVSLQIVKGLLALVLSTTILIHHSSLLKAIRTVYNVFLLSQDPVNQMVAQGGLTQMVNHVFSRCKTTPIPDSDGINTLEGLRAVSVPYRVSRAQTPSTPDSALHHPSVTSLQRSTSRASSEGQEPISLQSPNDERTSHIVAPSPAFSQASGDPPPHVQGTSTPEISAMSDVALGSQTSL